MDGGQRREDWNRWVEEQLASLNSSLLIWQHEIKALKKTQISHDKLLRGDTDQVTDGMIARQHAQENEIRFLKAIVDADKAGNKGLVHRVESLEGQDKRSIEKWKFYAAILGTVAAIAVAVITNLDKIDRFFSNDKPDVVEQKLERARHPKARYRHFTVHVSSDGQETTTSP